MQTELKNAGVGDDTDDDDDDDDDDKPLTRGDLKRMQVSDASHTALEMAGAITDQEAKAAITAALADIKPSGDADADFKKAVAIASIDKNNKILEELRRKPMTTNHRSGSGAPPRPAGAAFEPTALEISYMKPPFNLTKEQIIASRPQ